jgi:hypothetical protein
MPGGYVVRDANDQAIAYVYSRANPANAMQTKVLTEDEARIAVNIAKLPTLLRGRNDMTGTRGSVSADRGARDEHSALARHGFLVSK